MKSISPESFATFGDLLRYLRQREKLTQRELSTAVGYSESQINRLEHNLRLPESSIVAAQFIPALHLEDEPEVAARLIELAAQARGEPVPASLTFAPAVLRNGVNATRVTLRERRTNLPAQMNSFIGREDEIAELAARVTMTRLLTLTGAGGVGKTRLALEMASRVRDEFPDGVWLVEYASLGDASLVPRAVATVFGLVDPPSVSPTDVLVNYFASKHLLIVFDNCEHLIEACARLADRLLRDCRNVHLLTTSREPLRIAGEVNWRVPSLSAQESVRLFVERARAVRSDFDLTDHDATVTHICQQLDGIPLAIELAVSRVNGLSVEQIATRLDDRFHLLTGGSRTALPRHKTLGALIDWSYTLLDPAEQVLFRQLSVFVGGFTVEAAQIISDQSNTFDHLSNLVDKSLVIAEVKGATARYRMLETIRQFADETLRTHASATHEQHALRRRHFDFYLQLAEEAEPKLNGVEATQWLNQLDADHGNLRAAIDWALASGESTSGLRLVAALADFWFVQNHHREAREQVLKALAKSDSAERTSLRAKVLNHAFRIQWYFKEFEEAHIFLEEALSIATALGDKRNIAQSLLYEQYQALAHKNFAAMRVFNEKALIAWRGLGDKFQIGHVLSLAGDLARHQGDYQQAQRWYEEAIGLLVELGETSIRARSLRRLGRVALEQGDYAKAASLCRQSLKLSVEAGNRREAASDLVTFAGLAVAQGQSLRAARLFGAVEALLHRLDASLLFGDAYNYEDDLSALRAQLDEETLAAAWTEGEAMTLDEAVKFAFTDSKPS